MNGRKFVTHLLCPLAVYLLGATPFATAQEARGALTLVGVVTVAPGASARIRPLVKGVVAEILVREGDQVKRGQILARLDARRTELERQRALARVKIAQTHFEAAKTELGEKEAAFARMKATDKEPPRPPRRELVDIAAAELDLAIAELRLVEHDLEATVIKAPIDGTVLAVLANLGEMVGGEPGTILFEVADLRLLEVSLAVPERDLGKIKHGAECEVRVEGSDAVFRASVARRSPTADPATATVRVHVEVRPSENGPDLHPGMHVRVTLLPKK